MKVEAYRCDRCGNLRPYEAITGINPTEDLFDRMASFPVVSNPAKVNFHVCNECYHSQVLEPARIIDRKKNEDIYKAKIKELGYLLRSTCVSNVMNRKKF